MLFKRRVKIFISFRFYKIKNIFIKLKIYRKMLSLRIKIFFFLVLKLILNLNFVWVRKKGNVEFWKDN